MTTANISRPGNMRGASLLLCLFALFLVSAVGFFMLLGSTTETRIDANYGSNLGAYYAARSGLEEVRNRIKYPSTPSPPAGGIADALPQNIAGNAKGVLYIVNPANGETVDPTDPANPYFDEQLCHDYDSGVPTGTKCKLPPATSGWNITPPAFSMVPASGPLGYKWVRVNLKTNRVAAPYSVDASAPLDSLVCWDGQTEQVSPGGASPACDANGMQNVYMLTSLGISQNFGSATTKKLLRSEVVSPSIRPPGAVTVSFASRAVVAFGTGIPNTVIDGSVHGLNGALLPQPTHCSSVAALATDRNQTTREMTRALNQLRLSIVNAANSTCNADGSAIGTNMSCSPGLWWVRGTDVEPRFSSTGSVSTQAQDGQTTGLSASQQGGSSSCDSSTPNCYLGLDLSAPQLMGIAATYADHIPQVTVLPRSTGPFSGNPGNQSDVALYQPAAQNTLKDEMAAVQAMVAASAGQPNYFAVTSSTIQTSYGSPQNPAIVVMSPSDPGLTLQNNGALTGYGVLIVPNLVLNNSTLQWTGIVLVTSQGGQFAISGATGSINGALLLQSGAGFNVQTGPASSSSFRITYSCDAIDLAFQALPFKVIASTEWNY